MVHSVVAGVMSVLFIIAASAKARNYRTFVETLTSSKPWFMRRIGHGLAPVVIIFEVSLAGVLLLRTARPVAAFLGIVFVGVTTSWIAVQLGRYAVLDCRCWSFSSDRDVFDPWDMGRARLGVLARDSTKPAFAALRNSTVAGALAHVGGLDVMFVAAVPSCLVGGGLLASVLRLRREPSAATHPLEAVFAPRLESVVAGGDLRDIAAVRR